MSSNSCRRDRYIVRTESHPKNLVSKKVLERRQCLYSCLLSSTQQNDRVTLEILEGRIDNIVYTSFRVTTLQGCGKGVTKQNKQSN